MVSPRLGDDINTLLNSNFNFEYIPNIVNAKFFNRKMFHNKDKSGFVFLSVGNLTERKGHSDLITAFAKVYKDNTAVILRIVGSGEQYNRLEKLIFELGMENQIFLTGSVSREQMVNEYANADCFVLSSYYETFGVVLIEALASGLPVVATASGGPEYIVTEKNGYLYPPGDIENLAGLLIRIQKEYNKFNRSDIRKMLWKYIPKKRLQKK